VVGATGYTGALVVQELVSRGVDLVAIGRSREKLDALPGDLERRVADAGDEASLVRALAGCDALVTTVGPFVDHGEPVVRAAVEAGVHYIDTTGEQAFMRTVFERYDRAASSAGIAVVPAIGFDYVPGDMAAALAAQAAGGTPDRIDVHYLIRKAKASGGTKRTGMRVAALPCLVWKEGRLVEDRIGGDGRRFLFAEGEANVALWPGGEPVTVPRHTGARNVSTYMRLPKAASALIRGAGKAASLAQPLAGTDGPSPEERGRGRYEVVAVADGVRCTVEGHDMYGMTAAACAEALQRLADGGPPRAGVLAPAEAFDPAAFLDAMRGHLTWRVGS